MNLEELMKDEAFANKVADAEDFAEVAKLFQEKGVEVTAEELEKASKEVDPKKADELNETDLENVAGGSAPFNLAIWILIWVWQNGRRILKRVRR